MAALQFAMVPGYAALILRRTLPELRLPGGLIDRAFDWLHGKAQYSAQDHRWRFPSGATLQFGYCELERDVHRYQSSEFQFVGMDEATQFTEKQLRYLFSRLRRRADIPVPVRYRLASNPGNVGHEFVKDRYITHPEQRVFIPARLDDNPHIDRGQYLESLANLDPITRDQLLKGDWDAALGGRFQPSWFERARYRLIHDEIHFLEPGKPHAMLGDCLLFGTVDAAASTAEEADYTVASAWAVTPAADLVWLDMIRGRWEVPDITPRLATFAHDWGLDYLAIEGGGPQKGISQLARRARLVVKELLPGKRDKLVRATPAINLAASGKLYVPVQSGWLNVALAELYRFTGTKADAHDDIVDTLAWAVRVFQGKEDRTGTRPPRIIGGKL